MILHHEKRASFASFLREFPDIVSQLSYAEELGTVLLQLADGPARDRRLFELAVQLGGNEFNFAGKDYAIHYCIKREETYQVLSLLAYNNNIDVHIVGNFSGRTPLFTALHYRKTELINDLLQRGADRRRCPPGMSPLTQSQMSDFTWRLVRDREASEGESVNFPFIPGGNHDGRGGLGQSLAEEMRRAVSSSSSKSTNQNRKPSSSSSSSSTTTSSFGGVKLSTKQTHQNIQAKEEELIYRCAGVDCAYQNANKTLFVACRCHEVVYCSKTCQTSHWKAGHKAVCVAASTNSTSSSSSSSKKKGKK